MSQAHDHCSCLGGGQFVLLRAECGFYERDGGQGAEVHSSRLEIWLMATGLVATEWVIVA